MIYLDNSATTAPATEVLEAMNRGYRHFANASSVHRGGQGVRVLLEETREGLAKMLGAESKEVIFTSGGTEANNHALKGYGLACFMERGIWPTFVIPRNEHHAVLHPVEFLERLGAPTLFLEVDQEGRVAPEALRRTLEGIESPEPPLVSIMHANNETGTINPVRELAAVTHEAGGLFHTDAVQTFGKIPCNVQELGVDMLTVSAHKIHGPKGIGALYLNKNVELEPLIHGGSQERNRRGGTEPTALVLGFHEAARLAVDDREHRMEEMETLHHRFRQRLSGIEGLRFNTPEKDRLATILNITFDDAERLDGEGLIVGLDLLGIAVSNGSACTSGSLQPSHVLSAMGRSGAQARAAVRFSMSRFTTAGEIDRAAEALEEVVTRMRAR